MIIRAIIGGIVGGGLGLLVNRLSARFLGEG